MEVLAEALLRRGACQRIADLAGVDQSTVSRIGRGVIPRPSYEIMTKVLDGLRQYNEERAGAKSTPTKPTARTTKPSAPGKAAPKRRVTRGSAGTANKASRKPSAGSSK